MDQIIAEGLSSFIIGEAFALIKSQKSDLQFTLIGCIEYWSLLDRSIAPTGLCWDIMNNSLAKRIEYADY
jgi:hypothetical protein